MKKDNLELMNKISFAIERNNNFIIDLNNKAEITNKDLLAAITTVNDNLQKYQHLNNLLYKGEIKCQ
jgi:hypothetical protein